MVGIGRCERCQVELPMVLCEPVKEDCEEDEGVAEVRIAMWDDGGHGICLRCLGREYPTVVRLIKDMLV